METRLIGDFHFRSCISGNESMNHLYLVPLALFKGKIQNKIDNRRVLLLSCRLIHLNQVNSISLMFHSFGLSSLNLLVNSSSGILSYNTE